MANTSYGVHTGPHGDLYAAEYLDERIVRAWPLDTAERPRIDYDTDIKDILDRIPGEDTHGWAVAIDPNHNRIPTTARQRRDG